MPKLIRASYELDADTVRQLKRLARRWHVSEAEALRRLVRVGVSRRRKLTPGADSMAEFIAPHTSTRRVARPDR